MVANWCQNGAKKWNCLLLVASLGYLDTKMTQQISYQNGGKLVPKWCQKVELLAGPLALDTFKEMLSNRYLIHFIDNSAT